MSAPVVLRSSGPALCPSFAEVCSFLERYGAALDLPEMTFPQMERYLRDTTTGEGVARVVVVAAAGARKCRELRHQKPKASTTTTIPLTMEEKRVRACAQPGEAASGRVCGSGRLSGRGFGGYSAKGEKFPGGMFGR